MRHTNLFIAAILFIGGAAAALGIRRAAYRQRKHGAPKSRFVTAALLGAGFAACGFCFDAAKLWVSLFFLCVLLYASLCDIDRRIIPDGALAAAVLVKLVPLLFDLDLRGFVRLLADGLALSLPVLLLVLAIERLSGREALGGGDIKLLFVMGLYLGAAQTALALLFACCTGAACGMAQKDGGEIAFGPHLALGAALSLILGGEILRRWLPFLC